MRSDVIAVTVTAEAATENIRSETRTGVAERLGLHVRMLLFLGLVFAVLIRLAIVLASNFPLNDGGMFDVMIRDLQHAHYSLPHFTTYNSMHIPYAYPPLAFYVSAFLADVTHSNSIEMLRLLPLLLNIAAIGAFALLARSILRSRDAVMVAVVAFSFLPHSVLWQVMGGGLTRGFGFLFALLALHQGYELFAKHAFWRVTPTVAFATLTVLSHPKMAWFLAYSLALFVLWYGRSRRGLFAAVIVAVATAGLSAPWWLSVIRYHGVAPFLASARSGSAPWGHLAGDVLRFNISGESLFPLIGLIAVVGIIWSIRSRQWFLVVWLAMMMPLDSREYLTDTLVPVSLFAGIGYVEVLMPWLSRIDRSCSPRWSGWLRSLSATFLLLYMTIGLIAACASTDVPLTKADQATMAWITQNTPQSSRFLIITGSPGWATDRQSEWFPALTDRTSVATVQGTEWLDTSKRFSEYVKQYNSLQKCSNQSVSCLESWTAQTESSFDYIYVSETLPIGGSPGSGSSNPDAPYHFAIEYSLKSDPNYTLVFENSGAAIFKRN